MKRLYFLVGLAFYFGNLNAQVADHVVISEVYGGGGNSGSVYKNDFIELYNPTSTSVDLNGWSVQYIVAGGTGTWAVTNLTGTIPAHGFFLIQEDQGSGGSANLPSPDVIGTINISATGLKVALVNTTTALSGACPSGAQIIDMVGAGSSATCYEGSYAPAPSNTASIVRKANATSTAASLAPGGSDENSGNGWDSNNNNSDFVATTNVNQINPQNSAIVLLPVKLIAFNVFKNHLQIKLTWTSAEEINAKEFIIERSSNGYSYSSVGKLAANGNKASGSNYQFHDASPNAGVNFYRLKMVDGNGKSEYSKILKIDFNKIYTIAISPNPFKSYFNITITDIFEPIILKITDVSGRLVHTQTLSGQNNSITVNRLTKGVYFANFKSANTSHTEKIFIE